MMRYKHLLPGGRLAPLTGWRGKVKPLPGDNGKVLLTHRRAGVFRLVTRDGEVFPLNVAGRLARAAGQVPLDRLVGRDSDYGTGLRLAEL